MDSKHGESSRIAGRCFTTGTFYIRLHNWKEVCYICGDGGELILCDGGCNRAYHLECLELESIPQDDKWLCPYCELKKQHASDPPVTYVDAPDEKEDEKDEDEEKDEEYGTKKRVRRRLQKKKRVKVKVKQEESVPEEGSTHRDPRDRESNEEPEQEQVVTQPADSDESVHEEDVRDEEEEDPSIAIKAIMNSRYRRSQYDDDEPYLQHASKTRKRRSPEVSGSTSHASREPFICPVMGCDCISENRTSMLSHAY